MALALTSTLDAVNTMLSVIGEAPVNTIENTGLIDAVLAKQILDETMRQIQEMGWDWNTDEEFVLTPTFPTPGEIYVPANTLKVDATDPSRKIVQRGLRLYDKDNQNYTFTDPLTVNIVRLFEFEEIPQVARQYIMVRAARIFQDRVVGSATLSGFNSQDELRALIALKNAEAENADLTILNNTDTTRILGWPRRI